MRPRLAVVEERKVGWPAQAGGQRIGDRSTGTELSVRGTLPRDVMKTRHHGLLTSEACTDGVASSSGGGKPPAEDCQLIAGAAARP